MCRTNVQTVCTNTAFFTVFLATVAVASITFGAVKSLFYSTLDAYCFAHYFTAILTVFDTVKTPIAFFAPAGRIKITTLALRAVAAFF